MLLFTSCSKLSVLKFLHDHHYIHLDVKPDNFMIGIGDYKVPKLIQLGVMGRFRVRFFLDFFYLLELKVNLDLF